MLDLRAAAIAVHQRALDAYTLAAHREQNAKEEAAREKTAIGHGYWEPAHAARLRLKSATAVLNAIMEVSG